MKMAVSDKPWHDFSQADYTPQQWARACLIDTETGDPASKDRYKLPVREPSGEINRNAVHAAAARLNQVEDVAPEKRAAAARKLITIYRTDLGETPPDGLENMDKSGGERSAPQLERLWVSTWFDRRESPVEIRMGENGRRTRNVGGYAAMFNKRSLPMQGFVEIVERSFFNKSRADGWPNVVCRYNHKDDFLLGTTASGTLKLNQDDLGLDYCVDVPECRNDVYEMVQRGDVRNSSFAFRVYDEEWKQDSGYPVRHLLSGQLVDVAPVCTPAYPDATVGLRSLAASVGAPIEDVVKLAEVDELRRLFIRTDKRGGRTTPLKPKSGRQAQMEIMSMRPDDPIVS